MFQNTEANALDFVRTDLVPKIRAMYERPPNVKDEESALLWLEGLTTAIVSTSRDRRLILQGWIDCTKTYRGKTWPPIGAICRHIEALKPTAEQRSEKTIGRSDGRNAKGLAQYLQDNMRRVVEEWWMYNSAWIDDLFRELRIEGGDPRQQSGRGVIEHAVERAAHYHCQLLYWEVLNGPLDLEADFATFRERDRDHMEDFKKGLDAAVRSIRVMVQKGWPSPFGAGVRESAGRLVDPAALAKIMGSSATATSSE